MVLSTSEGWATAGDWEAAEDWVLAVVALPWLLLLLLEERLGWSAGGASPAMEKLTEFRFCGTSCIKFLVPAARHGRAKSQGHHHSRMASAIPMHCVQSVHPPCQGVKIICRYV